jgi:hypothetical protein
MFTSNVARAALAAAGIVLAAGGFWAGKSLTTATLTPSVLSGAVGIVGVGGDEFTIRLSGQRQLSSYGLTSMVSWRSAYGIWSQGTRPPCLTPLSHGQRITFGIINAAPVADAPGGPVVVWIECPSRRIPHYPIVSAPTASAGVHN